MAPRAMPAAWPRAPPTPGRAAEADERQRGRRPEIVERVELIERRDFTHKPPFAARFDPPVSHVNILVTLVFEHMFVTEKGMFSVMLS